MSPSAQTAIPAPLHPCPGVLLLYGQPDPLLLGPVRLPAVPRPASGLPPRTRFSVDATYRSTSLAFHYELRRHNPFLQATAIPVRQDPKVPDAQATSILGMLQRGHDVALVAAVLRVPEPVVESVAQHNDLVNALRRPFRQSRHKRAWTVGQYASLAELWQNGSRAADIAEALGRSQSSIWRKRRFLGLPRRNRVYFKVLSTVPVELTERQKNALLPLDDTRRILTLLELRLFTAKDRLGRSYYIDNSPDDLVMSFHRSRDELVWTRETYHEVSMRVLSGQHMLDIANDFGTTLSTIMSVAHRLELPRRTQMELVHHFDPPRAVVNMEKLKIYFRQCNGIAGWFFWTRIQGGSRRSRRYENTRSYKDAAAIA